MTNVNYFRKCINEKFNITEETKDPAYVTDNNISLLEKFYLKENETTVEGIARTLSAFSFGDDELAKRLYKHCADGDFFFASPLLSNSPLGMWKKSTPFKSKQFWEDDFDRKSYWLGEIPRAMPISCFLMYVPDTIDGQVQAMEDLARLSVAGGGLGMHNGLRTVSDKAPGPIPYEKTVDANIGYYRQGVSRRGSVTYYVDISHPEIIEHIKFRIVTGGDPARKSDNRKNFHTGVNISEEFVKAYFDDAIFVLQCPHTKETVEEISARKLFIEILDTREKTGEPMITFLDVANEALNPWQKALGMTIKGSNLCNEIYEVTDEERIAVCCLSSLNLARFDYWKDTNLVRDLITLLDNVLQFFIDFAPKEMSKAVYSAKMERSLGLGAMGFSDYLQQNSIAFESGGFNSAAQFNNIAFSNIKEKAVLQTFELGKIRGEPKDLIGSNRRNANLLAIAPNANSGNILSVFPSCEPPNSNAYSQPGRAGTVIYKNKHLQKFFEDKGLSKEQIEDAWKNIMKNEGSVLNLPDEILDQEGKKIFKTAWEIDQHWVVQHAEDRQPYICQGQSLNVYFLPGSLRKYVRKVHEKAMKGRILKGLYYLRSDSKVKADTVKDLQRQALVDWDNNDCVGCQG